MIISSYKCDYCQKTMPTQSDVFLSRPGLNSAWSLTISDGHLQHVCSKPCAMEYEQRVDTQIHKRDEIERGT